MADQTLAQSGALKEPFANPSRGGFGLGRKVRKVVGGSCCWARYMLVGARRGVPALVDLVVRNNLFGALQIPEELESLGEILAARRPERALEIGTAKGGTLLFLTRLASPQATIVSVDLPGGRFGGGYGPRRRWFYQRFARRKQKIHLLQGNSHSPEMLDRAKAALAGQTIDYLFIDGDHSYEGVKSDFEMYAPMVRKGGLIAFHDIVEGTSEMVGGVPRFWREVRPRYRHAEMINDPKQGGYGIGVLYVD
jgi:predicted O-methyltransferase YrrM